MCKDKQLILYLYSSFKRKRHEETCSLFVACRSAVYFLCHCFSVDGFRIGFASDFHYESRFTRKRLDNAIRALQSLNADVLLLGGDYGSPKGGDMDTLFTALGKVLTPYGIYGVMGNHDYSY